METINEQNFIESLKNNKISPYQIYNFDIEYPQFFSVQHYLNNPHDDINTNQKLNCLFFDIEVYAMNSGEFAKPDNPKFPISAITIYSNAEKVYHTFINLIGVTVNKFPQNNLEEIRKYYIQELLKNGYIDETEDVKLYVVNNNEFQLLNDCWQMIHKIDPVMLSGFFADGFDLPYIYERLKKLTDNNDERINYILSKIGCVKKDKMGEKIIIKIADYPLLDIQYLYKPRADGGLNYGRKQPSYSLDYLSNEILGLKKLEYKNSGMSLDHFYEQDPIHYYLYNIIDVVLVNKINNKLKHIELHNTIRRLMKTPLSMSIRGPSALFDTFVLYELSKKNQKIRYGLNSETQFSIDQDTVLKTPKPKTKLKWIDEAIKEKSVREITGRFPGAYVKESPGKLFADKDQMIIDLDAASLYPSMIHQNNISFDTYYGRVLDPITSSGILKLLKKVLGTNNKYPDQLLTNVMETSIKYVDNIAPQNKNEYTQKLYIIIVYLLNKLKNFNIPLDNIFNPSTQKEYIVLKLYLIPLIELMEEIHPQSDEYNHFVHDYLLIDDFKTKEPYLINIIENILQPNIKITSILSNQFENYLKSNNLCISLAGPLYYTHEKHEGLFLEFLSNMYNMRKDFKNKRDEKDPSTEEYQFYDMRQLTTKILMNTTYGLFGQSTFRYSNKWLAKSITVQGRLTLKIAQIWGDLYLESLKNNN